MSKLFSGFWLLLALLSLPAIAQDRTVTGRVTSSDDGTALPGVTVQLKGTNRGTSTDANGTYRLSIPDNARLVFSYIGYTSQEVEVGNRSAVNVTLQSSSSQLNEVVVVAYGQQERKSITGSITQVNADKIANRPFASVAQALQGNVAGLQSAGASGQPGANQQIRIRGIGSITAGSDPLYVIDGIPINAGDFSRTTTTSSTLAGLNPNDIESVSVLKDASATSIYGSRAANGVILITTKKGKGGKTNLRFDTEVGFNDLTLTDVGRPLNRAQYLELTKEGIANAGLSQANADAVLQAAGANGTADTDWFDLVNRRGRQQQYNLSASGGDNKTTFYLSGGYFDQQATTIGSSFKRYSGQVNVNHNVSEKLSLFSTLNVSNSLTQAPSQGGAFANPVGASLFLLPTQFPYNPDGTLNIARTDAGFPSTFNPLALVEWDRRSLSMLKGLGSFGGTYRFLPDLSFTTRYGIDYSGLEENNYNNPFHGDGRTANGRAYAYYTRLFNWVWTNTVDYRQHLNADRSFYADLKVGYESQKSKRYGISAMGEGFPPTTELRLPAVAATPKIASAVGSDYTFSSIFSNLSFNYKSRYSLSGSLRRDGSSRFGSNNRYGTFWSVGGAWNIDEEAFFKTVPYVSSLKLRASYGVNGNADLSNLTNGDYLWRATYGYGFNYNQLPGSAPNSIGNVDLTWELNKPFNVGIDLGVLKDRIRINADYYVRQTTNLLQSVPLSRTTGFSSIYDNVGSMENRGFEFALNATPVKSDLRWDVNFNIAFNQNKITALNNNLDIVSGLYIRRVGENFQTYYMREWAGVDPATGSPLWYKDATHAETTSSYTQAQRVLLGSASPKGFGGFTNTLAYKGFTLEGQLYFQYGNYVFDSWARYLLSDGFSPFDNKYARQMNRWQKPGDIAENPKYIYNNATNSYSASSRYLYKGDYLRLRNVTLGYDVPAGLIKRIGLSRVNVYARGTNLFTKTADNRLTFDPETRIDGQNDLQVPVTRTVTFGLNIGL